MMLRLILVRHGQAEEHRGGGGDHARRLTPRGQAEARGVGQKLAAALPLAGHSVLALASDAARTRETAALVAEAWDQGPLSFTFDSLLYLSGLMGMRTLIEPLDPLRQAVVLVVGHNPGLSEAASRLSGESFEMGTADAVVLSIEADSWAEALASSECWRVEAQLSRS